MRRMGGATCPPKLARAKAEVMPIDVPGNFAKSSTRPTLLPLPVPDGAHLGAVAADAHLAPAAAVVLGGVEKQPAAFLAGAAPGTQEVLLHEQRQRRQRDRSQDRRQNVAARI